MFYFLFSYSKRIKIPFCIFCIYSKRNHSWILPIKNESPPTPFVQPIPAVKYFERKNMYIVFLYRIKLFNGFHYWWVFFVFARNSGSDSHRNFSAFHFTNINKERELTTTCIPTAKLELPCNENLTTRDSISYFSFLMTADLKTKEKEIDSCINLLVYIYTFRCMYFWIRYSLYLTRISC